MLDNKFLSIYCLENDTCARIEIKDEGAIYSHLLSVLSLKKQKKIFIRIDLGNFRKFEELSKTLTIKRYDVFLLGNPLTGNSNKIYKISSNLKSWINIFNNKKWAIDIFCVKSENSLFLSFISHSAGGKGGSEKSLLNLVDGLIERGVLIHMIIPSLGPLEEEIKKRPVAYDIISFPWILKDGTKSIPEINEEIEKSAEKIAQNYRAINPDIVFTNTSVINVGAIAARKLKIPHVWHVREFGSKEHGMDFIWDDNQRLRYVYDNSDKIFFNSVALKDFYETVIPPDKSEVLYNVAKAEGVNHEINYGNPFKNEKSLKLILVGEVRPGKNQKDAILAVGELAGKGKNVELLIVGSWQEGYYNNLKKIIRENESENKIIFYGRVANAGPLMEKANVALMCSVKEAFGKVTVEAMLAENPVIGAKSGGTVEIVKDGYNGFLYEPGNHVQLAEKINYFLENPQKIKEMGQNGFEFVTQEFTDERYSGKAFKILKNMKREFSDAKKRWVDEKLLRKILSEKKTDAAKKITLKHLGKFSFKEISEIARKARFIWKNYGIKTFFKYAIRYILHGHEAFK